MVLIALFGTIGLKLFKKVSIKYNITYNKRVSLRFIENICIDFANQSNNRTDEAKLQEKICH